MRTLRNVPRCDSPLPADVRVTAWITGLLYALLSPSGRAPAPNPARPRARARGGVVHAQCRWARGRRSSGGGRRARRGCERSLGRHARSRHGALFYASTAATVRPSSLSPRSFAARHCHWRRSVAILVGSGCFGASSPPARTGECRTTRPPKPPSRSSTTRGSRVTRLRIRRDSTWRSFSDPVRPTRHCDALEQIGEGFSPGASDFGRATLLAMLGRIDEAWPLAEARAEHLREVSGDFSPGAEYLGLIALIDGDRERACRHTAEFIDEAPPGSDWRHGLVEVDACARPLLLGSLSTR